MFNNGSIVIAITITPMPPSHCKIDLHKRMLLGVLFKSVIMVEPVVVIPDILSKKESTNDKFKSDRKKGKDPKTATLNHDKVVNKNACCKFKLLFSSKFVRTRRTPINTVIVADDRKILFFSAYKNCIKNGISINTPNIIKSTPIAKKTVLKLFISYTKGYLIIIEIQHNKTLLYLYFTNEI